MDYKYGRLSLPAQAEDYNYKRGPGLLPQSASDLEDERSGSLQALVDVNRGQWWPWGDRKVKLYSFLFVVTVAFLITASYVLNGDKKGLLLTPSPYHFQVMSSSNMGGHNPYNLTFVRDYASLKEVVRSIVAKVEFSHRRLPELKDLLDHEPHIFSVIPHKFLTSVKNPCWYEEHAANISADIYKSNMYIRYSPRFQDLWGALREHIYERDGRWYRMRCLPYFYIIGQPKCGTTDLYDRLRTHPDVLFTPMKEPHWWTRRRFGVRGVFRRNFTGPPPPALMKDYLDLMDMAAFQIHDGLLADYAKGRGKRDTIIGEASASTMWDNNAWMYFYNNGTLEEPPFLVQDFIHALTPDAKFIVMLRDPVERLYSEYLYFSKANKSAEDFHERVSESLQLFEACLSESTMRSCIYNTTLHLASAVRLHVGLYIVYLLDWLSVYSKDQILVLRLEDHAANRKKTMRKVFKFLNLGPLSKEKEAEITKSPASNARRKADLKLGPMLPITRDILQQFYTPFNQRLAVMLQDKAFLWIPSPPTRPETTQDSS